MEIDLEKLIQIIGDINPGHLNPDYAIAYYNIDKNYPILMTLKQNKIWIPIELFIFALSSNSAEIPLLVKSGKFAYSYKLSQLRDAVVRNREDNSVNFNPIIDVYHQFVEKFSNSPDLFGGFLKNTAGAHVDVCIDFDTLFDLDTYTISKIPSSTSIPPKAYTIPERIQNLEMVDVILTSGKLSTHPILQAQKFTEIFQFERAFLGIKKIGDQKQFGLFISLNNFDEILLLLPISEIYIQFGDYIAGFIFSDGILIEQQYTNLRIAVLYCKILSNIRIRFIRGIEDIWKLTELKEFSKCVAFDRNFDRVPEQETKELFNKRFILKNKYFWIDEYRRRGII